MIWKVFTIYFMKYSKGKHPNSLKNAMSLDNSDNHEVALRNPDDCMNIK